MWPSCSTIWSPSRTVPAPARRWCASCGRTTRGAASDADLAFDRVVERLANGGPDEHLDAGDGVAVFVVPVVAARGHDLGRGDARVVDAAREPRAGDRRPELLDLGLVGGDGGVAVEVQE